MEGDEEYFGHDDEQSVRRDTLEWIRDKAPEMQVDETSSAEELKEALRRISSTTEEMIAVKNAEICALREHMADGMAQVETIVEEMQTTFDSYKEPNAIMGAVQSDIAF